MRTLSIRPPSAWLIMHLKGHWKNVENRSWGTRYRGPLLIHSSRTLTRDDFEWSVDAATDAGAKPADLPTWAALERHRGGIVGAVMLIDVLEPGSDEGGPWYEGDFGFQLADRLPLTFRPLRGKLNLYETEPTPSEAAALATWQAGRPAGLAKRAGPGRVAKPAASKLSAATTEPGPALRGAARRALDR